MPNAGSKRYDAWKGQAAGAVALDRSRDLLRALLAGWPRRSRSMLVFNAGSGVFLETLWEAGFDVTAQDSDPEYLARAQARLDEVQKGIVLACGSGDYSQEIVVQQKPPGVDADAVILSAFPNGMFIDLNKINGPWEFILQP